jgi:hypothetical protein
MHALPKPLLMLLVLLPVSVCAQTEQVGAFDDGGRTGSATWECTPGHKVLTRQVSLQNALVQYAFKYTGCQDPSHQGEHPASEGNFGMPSPSACNWYHSGFLTIDINGKDVVRQNLTEMRVTESGDRGGFQALWAHPDADVSLRTVLLPGANHVLCLLKWEPREGVTLRNVTVRLRCYPSFFTSARQRRGERHVKSPRTDAKEPGTLQITPAEDPWLLYYDTVFDVAKGEGEGPCAVVLDQSALQGGKVSVGDYAVMTSLDAKPQAGGLRLALYDFAGSTNADAEAYLQTNGLRDQAELLALDFRPKAVRELDLAAMRAEATQLLAEAADDGVALKPKVDALLKQVTELATKGQGGDWRAEAELAATLRNSEDLFWKLKIYAVLNRPLP